MAGSPVSNSERLPGGLALPDLRDAHGRPAHRSRFGRAGEAAISDRVASSGHDVDTRGSGVSSQRKRNAGTEPTAIGGWLFKVEQRLRRKKGLTDQAFPAILAQAVLSRAKELTPLDLVDALKKCQEMGVRAALLPSKSGVQKDELADIRRHYAAMFSSEPVAVGVDSVDAEENL